MTSNPLPKNGPHKPGTVGTAQGSVQARRMLSALDLAMQADDIAPSFDMLSHYRSPQPDQVCVYLDGKFFATAGAELPAWPQVTVLNGDSKPVQQGKIGEVCLRGPNVTKGYLNRPEANEEVLHLGWSTMRVHMGKAEGIGGCHAGFAAESVVSACRRSNVCARVPSNSACAPVWPKSHTLGLA